MIQVPDNRWVPALAFVVWAMGIAFLHLFLPGRTWLAIFGIYTGIVCIGLSSHAFSTWLLDRIEERFWEVF